MRIENPDLADKKAKNSDIESDYDDEETGFEGLSQEEITERTRWLWFILMLKAKGAAGILKTFNGLNHRILEFGTKRGILKRKEDEFMPYWFIIETNSTFKNIWNIVVMILLIYTATYAPYRMAFIEEVSLSIFIFESFIDFLFFMDLCVNFIAAYEK